MIRKPAKPNNPPPRRSPPSPLIPPKPPPTPAGALSCQKASVFPRPPRLLCLKGAGHGEAVTGGFLSPRTSCNPSVGATLAVARPDLHRIPCNAFVGATLAVARPADFLQPLRRGRRLPTVVPTDSRPLLWPPIGALPRNQLASSATGGASPISPTPRFTAPLVTLPPGLAPHSMKNHVIAKPVRTLAVAIRSPSPRPPCLKGAGTAKP